MQGAAPEEGTGHLVAGRYRIEEHLGRGGMATVYRVQDTSTGTRLALKQMNGKRADSTSSRLHFRREFHTMARLEHPRIVDVFDYGIDEGVPYYTMEWLDGEDFRGIAPIPPEQAGWLLRDLTSALAYLHGRRLVHRDVAPANVRCTSDGHAKLIDFGVLTTPGQCDTVAGTPPYIAPETVRSNSIDHRADLFSLGALAYWLLTGERAYPAKRVQDLEPMWARPIASISEFRSDVPAALEELVHSLLRHDPLQRPRSAPEVMDRLGAILDLDPAPELEVARSYLATTALVGRQRELRTIRQQVADASEATGSLTLIEGPSGIGKSRLLRETRLEAQIAGLRTVTGQADQYTGPYGVVQQLARGLLRAAPEQAEQAAHGRDQVLARAVPELRPHLQVTPDTSAEPTTQVAHDERIRLQNELSRWFLDVSQRAPCLLAIDDIQRCDEASAAVLTSLTRDCSENGIAVVAALRTDESIRVPLAVATLRDAGTRMRLHGLSHEETEELVETTFGQIRHAKRLAQWLFRVTGGNPLHCTEVPRQLVDRGVIRYRDGEWVIDEEFEEEDLPKMLAQALDARIEGLPQRARRLAEALSVHGGELPLELCVALADEDEEQVFSDLDALTREEVLDGGTEVYRFRHDGLREALLRHIESEHKRVLHLKVGHALEQLGVTEEREAEIGWHLLEGGQRDRAAELLERAGRRLFDMQAFADAVGPLEAALRVYEEHNSAPSVCLELRMMLLHGGSMANRQVALRHADAALQGFRYYGGVPIAERLRPWTGRHLALIVALLTATVRRWVTPASRRGPPPIHALRELFKAVAFTNSAASTTFTPEKLLEVSRTLEPVAISTNQVSYGSQLLSSVYADFRMGRFVLLQQKARQVIHILEHDQKTPMRPVERMSAASIAWWGLAVTAAWRGESSCEQYIAELGRIPVRAASFMHVNAQAIRHRLRGEEDDAQRAERDLELRIVQAGSGWAFRVSLLYHSTFIYGFLGDVMGLKRSVEELSQLQRDGYDFAFYTEYGRGEYYRERGNLDRAEASLRRALELVPETHLRDRSAAFMALAETLLARGEHDLALQAAEEGLVLNDDPQLELLLGKVRGNRAVAYAEAALGDTKQAMQRLAHLHQQMADAPSPAARGLVAEARATLAQAQGDQEKFQQMLSEAEDAYRATGNPVLVGRLARLPDPQQDRPSAPPVTGSARPLGSNLVATLTATVTATLTANADPSVRTVLGQARGPLERAARTLDLILKASSTAEGFLFLLNKERLRLLSAIPDAEPDRKLRQAANTLVEREQRQEGRKAFERSPTRLPPGWHAIMLRARMGPDTRLIGIALVAEGALPFEPPDEELVEQAASWLFESGDVSAAV